MLATILTVITLGLASFLTAFLNHRFNLNIQGFSIAYIFPIGAALVGGLAAVGLFIGTKLSKQPIRTWMIPLAMLIGLASFFTSTYGDYHYAVQDIKEGIEAKYGKLSAKDLEDFNKKVSQDLNFYKYLEYQHNESTITLTSRSNRKGTKIKNSVVSAISFWLSVAGGAIGGWAAGTWAVGERTKDKSAKMYRDLKYTASVAPELYDDLVKQLDTDKKLDQAVVKILNDNKHDKIFKGNKPRTVIRVLKTRSNGTGQLMMELHDVVNNNDRVLSKLTKDLTAEQMVAVQATINQLQPKETF
jgi:hypothetical protein